MATRIAQVRHHRLLAVVLGRNRYEVDEPEPRDLLSERRADARGDPAGRAGEHPCLIAKHYDAGSQRAGSSTRDLTASCF